MSTTAVRARERELTERIVAELRSRRELINQVRTGRVIVHVAQDNLEKPVVIELQFKP